MKWLATQEKSKHSIPSNTIGTLLVARIANFCQKLHERMRNLSTIKLTGNRLNWNFFSQKEQKPPDHLPIVEVTVQWTLLPIYHP